MYELHANARQALDTSRSPWGLPKAIKFIAHPFLARGHRCVRACSHALYVSTCTMYVAYVPPPSLHMTVCLPCERLLETARRRTRSAAERVAGQSVRIMHTVGERNRGDLKLLLQPAQLSNASGRPQDMLQVRVVV